MAEHYIRLDNNNRIIKGFSTDFEQPIDGDICVNEDGGRHFNLELLDERGLPKLKYIDNEIQKTTEEDLKEKIAEIEKREIWS